MLQTYSNILVPLDGSHQAEIAFSKAIEVAKRNDAQIDILSVVDVNQYGSFGNVTDGNLIDSLVSDSKGYLTELVEKTKAEQAFNNIKIHVRFGNPKSVIARDFLADYPAVDLIMMGASGMNAMNRIITGSVTAFVIRNSKVDVIVVRTGMDNQLETTNKK